MIIRIWKTKIQSTRMAEYETFAQKYSLPMFRKQLGFLGVIFLGKHKDRAVLTIWKDQSSVDALAHSYTYQETSAKLSITGVLVGQTSVEVFEVQKGALKLQSLKKMSDTK